MKIAQLSPYFYPHLGGVESHVLELSKHLKERGHDVFVMTSKLEGTGSHDRVEGIEVIRVKPLTIQFSTPIIPGVTHELLDRECDIIHSHSPPPLTSFFGVRGAKKKGVPFVLTYHCDLELENIFGPPLVEMYHRTFGTYTVSQADKIITTSSTYGATSRAVWYRNSEIIPNAVDCVRFNPENDGGDVREKHGVKEDENLVLYVGRLVFHKGLEYLVESATYLEDDTKYIFVGTGDFREELKRRVRENDLEDRIIFAGRVSNEELPDYYGAADVFVLPSVSRLEAFGIVALEAMASGVPVVVSDIPGVREVIKEGRHGLLAEPMNARDIAGKVRVILENPTMARKMGEKGRKKVEENLRWEIVTDQIEEVYREFV